MLSDRNFTELCRLYKRLQPRTRVRPEWWLFQRWLRKRPMNHEFLISPIADYLLSVGASNETVTQIAWMEWPKWCHEFSARMQLLCNPMQGRKMPSGHTVRKLLAPIEPNVRESLRALDSMRGWTAKIAKSQERAA